MNRCREHLRRRGLLPRIARKDVESKNSTTHCLSRIHHYFERIFPTFEIVPASALVTGKIMGMPPFQRSHVAPPAYDGIPGQHQGIHYRRPSPPFHCAGACLMKSNSPSDSVTRCSILPQSRRMIGVLAMLAYAATQSSQAHPPQPAAAETATQAASQPTRASSTAGTPRCPCPPTCWCAAMRSNASPPHPSPPNPARPSSRPRGAC